MVDRLTTIKASNLGGIRYEMDTLREEVRSLKESHMIAIPPVIPSVLQTSPPYGLT